MKYLVTITVSRTEINTKHIFKIACTLLDDDHACYLIDTDRVIPMIGLTSLPYRLSSPWHALSWQGPYNLHGLQLDRCGTWFQLPAAGEATACGQLTRQRPWYAARSHDFEGRGEKTAAGGQCAPWRCTGSNTTEANVEPPLQEASAR